MFQSLDEQMKHDDALQTTPRERALKWAAIAVTAAVVFGGLYLAIQVFA